MFLYSIFDKKIGEYMQPFVAPNVTSALRSIQQALKSDRSTLSQYPHDFALYDIGSFDKVKGTIEAYIPNYVEEIANLASKEGVSNV